MSSFRINPIKDLRGEITIPPSKSHTLRAILFAMMGKGKSVIHNSLNSPDAEAMVKAISQFGARVRIALNRLEIEGTAGCLKPAEDVIQAGSSGQVLRFVGAMAALLPTYTIFTGDHSIRHQRPMSPLLQALEQLGALAVSSRGDGYAPVIIRGPIHRDIAHLSGEDSQPVSALLIATAFLPQKTTLFVSNPGEKPWIDLTLSWLKKFNICVDHHNYEQYTVFGNAAYEGFEAKIPGDWSSAAYPIAAALITQSEITVHNVDVNDVQGDKKFIDIIRSMGANIDVDEASHRLTIRRSKVLKGIKIDINNCIDMITLLPVIACFAEGETEILNAGIARHKECDRIHAIATELKKMGAKIEERPDGLVIFPSLLKGAPLKSYQDHRMALALSVAALAAEGASEISDVACIAKTYSTFQKDLNALGASIL